MTTEALSKAEAISEERMRSIFYSSFDIAQGDMSTQALLLARVFAKHPDIHFKFKEMNLDKDQSMIKQIEHKVATSHRRNVAGSGASETQIQISTIEELFEKFSPDYLKGDKSLEMIIGQILARDHKYSVGRKRVVNGEETLVYKFYLIEHGILGEPYRGDKVWQEFFSDIHDFLEKFRLREHDWKLGGRNMEYLAMHFALYNHRIESDQYHNKRCKEVELTKLPLFQ